MLWPGRRASTQPHSQRSVLTPTNTATSGEMDPFAMYAIPENTPIRPYVQSEFCFSAEMHETQVSRKKMK